MFFLPFRKIIAIIIAVLSLVLISILAAIYIQFKSKSQSIHFTQIYEHILVITIKRNTTFSYLGRRQRARRKPDESKEAMLSEDDNNPGLARLKFFPSDTEISPFVALHITYLNKKGRPIYPTTNPSTGISNNSYFCCVFYFIVDKQERLNLL